MKELLLEEQKKKIEQGTIFIGTNGTLYEYSEEKVKILVSLQIEKINSFKLQTDGTDYSSDSDEVCCKIAKKQCITKNKNTSCRINK